MLVSETVAAESPVCSSHYLDDGVPASCASHLLPCSSEQPPCPSLLPISTRIGLRAFDRWRPALDIRRQPQLESVVQLATAANRLKHPNLPLPEAGWKPPKTFYPRISAAKGLNAGPQGSYNADQHLRVRWGSGRGGSRTVITPIPHMLVGKHIRRSEPIPT